MGLTFPAYLEHLSERLEQLGTLPTTLTRSATEIPESEKKYLKKSVQILERKSREKKGYQNIPADATTRISAWITPTAGPNKTMAKTAAIRYSGSVGQSSIRRAR